jgi:hypothetical protein
MVIATANNEDQGQYEHQAEESMKRLLVLIFVWTLLVVTGTLLSADAQDASSSQIAGGDTSQALPQTLLSN